MIGRDNPKPTPIDCEKGGRLMPIRVLLALESPMLCETLADLLARQEGIEVVGHASEPLDLLVAVEKSEADVVLLTFPEFPNLPGVCSHLFAEFPELVVLGVSPDGQYACTCRQEVRVKPLEGAGLDDVLAEIRSVPTTP